MLSVAICIPAYNEEKNISQLLKGLLAQKTKTITISHIVIVSSGSTDKTDDIVEKYCHKDPRIQLIREKKRHGKAHAINCFLRVITDPIVVIQSADTIPTATTIEKLCHPFVEDPSIGMTGGAPVPVNDRDTFLGYIIHAWWWFHRNIPRFGEIIAYRNILPQVAENTAVDEAYIQAKMIQLGYNVVHIDDAVVYNKGPETVHDLIKQRRRIFNGHARLHRDENIHISNMTKSSFHLLLFKFKMKKMRHLFWLIGGILLEIWARFLGAYDTHILKLNPYAWDTATSTKDLAFAYEENYEADM